MRTILHAYRYDIDEADARLIAAAPKLLEAARLKRNVIITAYSVPSFEGDWIAVPREDFDALRAAIAKAEKS